MRSSWNPKQLLTEPIHLKGKILSLQVTCKKNRCLARLCFDILQVVHQLARILQGFYCLARNLQEIYSSQETCTILARVVFFSTRELKQPVQSLRVVIEQTLLLEQGSLTN